MSHPRVAVIGAGVSGIAMAVRLRRAGLDRFVVFERSAGPGGTWFDNTFPGCAVDVESHAYSYSFMPYDWSRNYATGAECLQYLHATITRFDLWDHFRFSTGVRRVAWDDRRQLHQVTLADGTVEEFEFVVSCLGLLNNPRTPTWPGLADFGGPAFHTARWEHEHDLSDLHVAVVGTGSTAAQVFPALAERVREVTLFQRTPGWVFPKEVREYTQRQRRLFRRFPIVQRLRKLSIYRTRETGEFLVGLRDAASPQQRSLREACEAYIRDVVQDPELQRLLTPSYAVGCKRPILDSSFYAAFNRDNTHLVPHAVTRVEADGIVDDTGTHHRVDAIVMATGFTPAQFLASLDVRGIGGRSIHEIWGHSPRAFCGMTVPGVPNFFLLYGPNTNGGVSVLTSNARQAHAAARVIRSMARRGRSSFDTRPAWLRRWVAWVDARNRARTATTPDQCTNYYHSSDGQNVTQFPGRYATFAFAVLVLLPRGLVYRRARPSQTEQATQPREAGLASRHRDRVAG